MPTPTSGQQNPTSVNPLVYDTIIAGETVNARPKINRSQVRNEMLGRHGGGIYAVQTGLNLSIGSGLNVVVAIGSAAIDGPVKVAAATNVAVVNGITNGTIWLTQTGALTPSTNLLPPGGNVAFVGFYTSAGGVITAVDESGVIRLDQGDMPLRRTADIGCPLDTPPATIRFLNACTGGLFLWDTLAYQNLTNSGRAALTFSSDANKTLSAAEATNRMIDFTSGGTALTATRNVVLPLTPAGREWLVRNNSNGGQSLQMIGSSGAGVTIATTRYAKVMATGTDIIRITPDT